MTKAKSSNLSWAQQREADIAALQAAVAEAHKTRAAARTPWVTKACALIGIPVEQRHEVENEINRALEDFLWTRLARSTDDAGPNRKKMEKFIVKARELLLLFQDNEDGSELSDAAEAFLNRLPDQAGIMLLKGLGAALEPDAIERGMELWGEHRAVRGHPLDVARLQLKAALENIYARFSPQRLDQSGKGSSFRVFAELITDSIPEHDRPNWKEAVRPHRLRAGKNR